MKSRGLPDFLLLILVVILVGFGVVMILSSSSGVALTKFHNPMYFVGKQLMWASLGMMGLLVFMNIHYARLKSIAFVLFLLAVGMLILVLIVGVSLKGHRSWFGFGSVGIQPTEFVKLALALYLAALISKKGEGVRNFKKGLLPILCRSV